MIAVAWVISLIAALYLGYTYRKLWDMVRKFSQAIQEKQPKKEDTKTVIVDPDDLAQRVRYEQEERIKQLNNE